MTSSDRNEIRHFRRGWNHKRYFQNRYESLSQADQNDYDEQLELFHRVLRQTPHPFSGKLISYFRPGPFRGMPELDGWTWQEYRLKRQNRVIALVKQVEEFAAGNLEFGLVARTFEHDHSEKHFRDFLKSCSASLSRFLAEN